MKIGKKLGTFGVITIVFTTLFINIQMVSSKINKNPVIIEVEYFPQVRGKYCGQATAQMVLYETTGVKISQSILIGEMNYTKGKGTRNTNIATPFDTRNITIISTGKDTTQRDLKQNINNGYYTIINIGFDENYRSGHFVVVTGYNSTGFFVHDPWPEKWGNPEGRDTGPYAYIDSDMLAELWSFRSNWALTVERLGPIDSTHESVEAIIWS